MAWAAVLLVSPVVHSAPLKRDRVDVFQLKSITKKRRHELTPVFSVGLNDNFVQLMNVGLIYTYHISEGLAFDLRFSYAFSSLTGLVSDLRASGSEALLQPAAGQTSTDKFNPTLSRPQMFATAHFIWSPFIGKFAVGKAVVDFDFYIFAGGGYINATRPGGQLSHMAGVSFGGGWRFLFTRWFSMRVEVQDIIFSQTLTNDVGAEVGVLTHSVFLSVGLSFFFPVKPVYTYQREP